MEEDVDIHIIRPYCTKDAWKAKKKINDMDNGYALLVTMTLDRSVFYVILA